MKISKENTVLLLAGAAVLAYVAWSKLRAVSNLVFTPGSITNMSFQGSTTIVEFTIGVQNTADTSVSIQSFAGNVYVNNQQVGNVSNFTPVTLLANSQTMVPITLQLGAFSAVQQIISAYTAKTVVANISIKGYANGVGFQAPINIDFSIGN